MTTADRLAKLLNLAEKMDRASFPVLKKDGFWFLSRPGWGVLITTNEANTQRAQALAQEFQQLSGGGSQWDWTATPSGWEMKEVTP